jgi:hypothetical protein
MTSGFAFSPLELSLLLFKVSQRRPYRRKIAGHQTSRHRQRIMAPGILAPEPTFTVKEMAKSTKEKHNFGAVIDDLDLDNISGEYNTDPMMKCCELTLCCRVRREGTI